MRYTRWRMILIGFDQLVNTFVGGYPDETISARAGRLSVLPDSPWRWKAARWFIDKLFWFEPNHCYEAWQAERLRRHMPGGYQ